MRMRKYYVEHLVFSLYFYSFDFFFRSLFAVFFLVAAAVGLKTTEHALELLLPAHAGLSRVRVAKVYQQKWPMTLLKAVVPFACETLLFVAVNIGRIPVCVNLQLI